MRSSARSCRCAHGRASGCRNAARCSTARRWPTRALVAGLAFDSLVPAEQGRFGRRLVRNHPFFNDLQVRLLDVASEAAGEELEISYNFLSLYSELTGFDPHLDAPEAKWTLDVCLGQSRPWPLQVSQVVPWPHRFEDAAPGWEDDLRSSADLSFGSYALGPGDGILLSGSSQWHFRDPLPPEPGDHCHLVFFHYIPKGTRELVSAFSHWVLPE